MINEFRRLSRKYCRSLSNPIEYYNNKYLSLCYIALIKFCPTATHYKYRYCPVLSQHFILRFLDVEGTFENSLSGRIPGMIRSR